MVWARFDALAPCRSAAELLRTQYCRPLKGYGQVQRWAGRLGAGRLSDQPFGLHFTDYLPGGGQKYTRTPVFF